MLRLAPHGARRKTRGRVVRYTFLVRIFHPLLHAGLARRTYKHGVKSMFEERRKASACPTIAQHSVCCSQRFSESQLCCSSINCEFSASLRNRENGTNSWMLCRDCAWV